MRQLRVLRVLRVVGAVAVAASSWVLAERLTSGAFGHRHVLAGGGAAVAHVHGSAILLAAASVVMACLAGVLVVALATGAGRTPGDPATGATGATGAAGAAAPAGAGQHGLQLGAGRLAAAAASGVLTGSLVVLDAALHARPGPGLVPHPGLLAAVAVVQAGVVGLAQLLWQWSVDLVLARGRLPGPVPVVLPAAGPVVPGRDVARPAGMRPRAVRGRGPPQRVLGTPCFDLPVSFVPTLT